MAATTVKSLLDAAPRELRFETELLLAQALNWSRSRVLAFAEEVIEDVIDASRFAQLKDHLARLHGGEPLAYITGHREFFSLEFAVTPDVLIPRPDTELLVELALEHSPEGARVADLGTGSGAIAISLKHARPDLQLTATDVSEAALHLAKQNAARHNCSIDFILSDWLQQLSGPLEVIVTNPPYVRPNDPHLPGLRFEPASALIANAEGLADIQQICAQAPHALTAGGKLMIEHGYDQAEDVAELLRAQGFSAVCTHRDLAGHPRVTQGSLAQINTGD